MSIAAIPTHGQWRLAVTLGNHVPRNSLRRAFGHA
jgi:hypothetical protein